MNDLLASQSEEDILQALESLRLKLYLDPEIAKAKLVEGAKQKRGQNGDLWTQDVRQAFGRCLRSFAEGNGIAKLRESWLDSNKASEMFIHGFLGKRFYHFHSPSLGRVRVTSLCCGADHIAVIVNAGFVMTKGANRFGQLGTGTQVPTSRFHIVSTIAEPVVDVAPGYAFTMAVGESGFLYGWGSTDNGRCALETESENQCVLLPRIVTNGRGIRFKKVAAGSIHGHAIDENGRMYAWGIVNYNGLHDEKQYTFAESNADVDDKEVLMKHTSTPLLMTSIQHENFFQVSVGPGGYHSLAVTIDGKLYGWGHNRVGQLTRIAENKDDYFVKVPRLLRTGVAFSSAGWGNSLFVSFDGTVSICGRNMYGQTGVDAKSCEVNERGHPYIDTFRTLEFPRSFQPVDARCGGEFTAVLGRDGRLFTWGKVCPSIVTHHRRGEITEEIYDENRNSLPYTGIGCTFSGLVILNSRDFDSRILEAELRLQSSSSQTTPQVVPSSEERLESQPQLLLPTSLTDEMPLDVPSLPVGEVYSDDDNDDAQDDGWNVDLHTAGFYVFEESTTGTPGGW